MPKDILFNHNSIMFNYIQADLNKKKIFILQEKEEKLHL
jgi:hypothetical protein